MSRIVLLENIHPSAKEVFTAAGYSDVVIHKGALTGQPLLDALQGAQAIGIRSRTHIDKKVLDALPDLRVIGCFCIGTNQVDLESAAEHGIPVFNAPFSNTRSVAELVIAETILLLRRIPEKNARVHLGFWDKSADGAYEARGKTMGIIGYGNIGTQVGILAEALGMHVLYHDVEAKLPLGNAHPSASLKKFLSQVDVVTLHVPGGKETTNLIDAEAIAAMRPGSILINASRGSVVDIPALHKALESGHVSGAAIDVFPTEPKSPDEPLDSPLRGLLNVILTPHIGGSTQESQENIGREVAEKLKRYLGSGTTKGAVNFPEIPYLEQVGSARIIHVHQNVPGAMGTLSNLMGRYGLNIVSQQLQTMGKIGFAITDIEGDFNHEVIQALRAHDITIRCDLL